MRTVEILWCAMRTLLVGIRELCVLSVLGGSAFVSFETFSSELFSDT